MRKASSVPQLKSSWTNQYDSDAREDPSRDADLLPFKGLACLRDGALFVAASSGFDAVTKGLGCRVTLILPAYQTPLL